MDEKSAKTFFVFSGLGFGVGLCISFLSCACNSLTCGRAGSSGGSFTAVIISTIIGMALGLIFALAEQAETNKRMAEEWEEEQARKEEERIAKEKYEKQQNLQKAFAYWENFYTTRFGELEQNVNSFDEPLDYAEKYARLEGGGGTETEGNINYSNYKEMHTNYLHSLFRTIFSPNCFKGAGQLFIALKASMCLKYIDSEDGVFADNACKKIEDESERLLVSMEKAVEYVQDGTCKCIAESLPNEYVKLVSLLMWYYAWKKPFEQSKFDRAVVLFERFTRYDYCDDDNNKVYSVYKVEEVLAHVYAKKNLGGEGTAKQEAEYVKQWIDGFLLLMALESQKYDEENNQELYVLASGLAWMELYDMELDVLHKLVAAGVQLSEELQSRLGFLESGGRADIKIYTDVPQNAFCYDSSSVDWRKKEFEIFFRKLVHKNLVPDYSLALERWTKTLPLMKGQKISLDALNASFEEMVEDFENEVACSRVRGEAINLANVVNEDATLFSFSSKRNRCVSMLFTCEKYGRNLNIEILTLFTPEKGVAIEELEKYCAAIKGNVYVTSFRETILQTVDESLKVREEMYAETPKAPKIFE